jgi:hypothetical protein
MMHYGSARNGSNSDGPTPIVPGKEDRRMGFQSADLIEFARGLVPLQGVSGIWLYTPTDHDASLYVLVNGLDPEAMKDRGRVYSVIEDYVQDMRPEMDESDFLFHYSVLVDDEEIGEPFIPSGAKQVA